ncbi:MAG TPA: aldose epimerase family protein [Candidatus Sulfotelmatobacter sp.]|nr:aldose epimerase family protein [Candidatus Sulfotelmatobacter sp.]
MIRPPALLFAVALFSFFSGSFESKDNGQKIQINAFGKTRDGNTVYSFTLSNKEGLQAEIINYGADLVSLKVPDRSGNRADVVLGYDTVAGYEEDKSYFGATIGRYGNRIAGGQFTLDNTVFHLPINDGPNTLHGGTIGFNKRLWAGTDRSGVDAQVLELAYTSPNGEMGFPGKLNVKVTYTLPRDKNEIRIGYTATTDTDTVINLTNHSYFNLTGNTTQDILHHELVLHATQFTPVDSTLIPTGELRSVANTAFDFTKPTAIGARINQDDKQLKFARGYDHNWVLAESKAGALRAAAEVFEPESGRVLEVFTTEPGIQFYSGNFLDGAVHGKGGQAYGPRAGFCLETQHFPDSPNHANFPSTVLKPGEVYRSTTILRFSTRN